MFWTQSWVEGEIVKGRLEAEGIPVDLILEQIESGSYEVPDDREDDAGRLPKREQNE